MTTLPLRIDSAAKSFGKVQASASASFEVQPGELLGLLISRIAAEATVIEDDAAVCSSTPAPMEVFEHILTPRCRVPTSPWSRRTGGVSAAPPPPRRPPRSSAACTCWRSRKSATSASGWPRRTADRRSRMSGEQGRPAVLRRHARSKLRVALQPCSINEAGAARRTPRSSGMDAQSRGHIYEMLASLRRLLSICDRPHHASYRRSRRHCRFPHRHH